jgi:hypothetical protein
MIHNGDGCGPRGRLRLIAPTERTVVSVGKESGNLAFNVWHALAVYRPWGGVNRTCKPSAWKVPNAGVPDAPLPRSLRTSTSQREQT